MLTNEVCYNSNKAIVFWFWIDKYVLILLLHTFIVRKNHKKLMANTYNFGTEEL